jgi:hypothetical protein
LVAPAHRFFPRRKKNQLKASKVRAGRDRVNTAVDFVMSFTTTSTSTMRKALVVPMLLVLVATLAAARATAGRGRYDAEQLAASSGSANTAVPSSPMKQSVDESKQNKPGGCGKTFDPNTHC